MNKNTGVLDKKLQMYISAIAMGKMPFGREWNSSAKELEDELRSRGIKLQKKLYYEYNMPKGITQSDFMDKIVMEYFCTYFLKPNGYAGEILKDKKLSLSEKAKIFKHVWHNRGKYTDVLKRYETEIRKLNPELANIRTDDPRSLVYGAMFGFAPSEIAYFADGKNRKLALERETLDIFKNRFGIMVGYILAPKTAEMIIAALEQGTRNKSKER